MSSNGFVRILIAIFLILIFRLVIRVFLIISALVAAACIVYLVSRGGVFLSGFLARGRRRKDRAARLEDDARRRRLELRLLLPAKAAVKRAEKLERERGLAVEAAMRRQVSGTGLGGGRPRRVAAGRAEAARQEDWRPGR
jgi:hypothetical protein